MPLTDGIPGLPATGLAGSVGEKESKARNHTQSSSVVNPDVGTELGEMEHALLQIDILVDILSLISDLWSLVQEITTKIGFPTTNWLRGHWYTASVLGLDADVIDRDFSRLKRRLLDSELRFKYFVSSSRQTAPSIKEESTSHGATHEIAPITATRWMQALLSLDFDLMMQEANLDGASKTGIQNSSKKTKKEAGGRHSRKTGSEEKGRGPAYGIGKHDVHADSAPTGDSIKDTAHVVQASFAFFLCDSADTFLNKTALGQLLTHCYTALEQFETAEIPLLRCFLNPYLSKLEWDAISNLVGFPNFQESQFTLIRLHELSVFQIEKNRDESKGRSSRQALR